MENKGAIIVRPKQPYMDWAAVLGDDGMLPEVDGEKTIYLVPCYEDDIEAEEVLKQTYCSIFESELNGWWTNEDDWPPKRTLKLFKRWFHVEFHSVVVDLS